MVDTRALIPSLILLLAMMPRLSFGTEAVGVVHTLKGRATVTLPNGDIREIRQGSEVHSSETLSTAAGSYARLRMRDDSWIMLRPQTRFVLEDVEYRASDGAGKGFFALLRGGFRAVSGLIRNKLNYRYRSSVATIGIRGTRFMVRLCDGDCYDIDPLPRDGLYVEVIDQTVVLSNQSGESVFHAGEYAYVADSRSLPQKLDSRPAVFIQSPIPVADPADCVQ